MGVDPLHMRLRSSSLAGCVRPAAYIFVPHEINSTRKSGLQHLSQNLLYAKPFSHRGRTLVPLLADIDRHLEAIPLLPLQGPKEKEEPQALEGDVSIGREVSTAISRSGGQSSGKISGLSDGVPPAWSELGSARWEAADEVATARSVNGRNDRPEASVSAPQLLPVTSAAGKVGAQSTVTPWPTPGSALLPKLRQIQQALAAHISRIFCSYEGDSSAVGGTASLLIDAFKGTYEADSPLGTTGSTWSPTGGNRRMLQNPGALFACLGYRVYPIILLQSRNVYNYIFPLDSVFPF